MRVDLRFYKRWDADLLALFEAGFKISRYLPEVLRGYVSSNPVKLWIPTVVEHDLNGQQLIHTTVTITDKSCIALLIQIKRGQRNAFCKALLRDALIQQSFGVFFSNKSFLELEDKRIAAQKAFLPDNVIICKRFKKNSYKQKLVQIIDSKDIADEVIKATAHAAEPSVYTESSEDAIIPWPSNRFSTVPDDNAAASEGSDSEFIPSTNEYPSHKIPSNTSESQNSGDSELLAIFKSMIS